MENIVMKVTGKKLVIEIDLSKELGNSKSGKSITIASTQGNQQVPGADEGIKIGLNVYKKPAE